MGLELNQLVTPTKDVWNPRFGELLDSIHSQVHTLELNMDYWEKELERRDKDRKRFFDSGGNVQQTYSIEHMEQYGAVAIDQTVAGKPDPTGEKFRKTTKELKEFLGAKMPHLRDDVS